MSSPGMDGLWLAGSFICPLTGLVFSPAGYPHTLLTQASPSGGSYLIANNLNMECAVLVYMIPDRLRPGLTKGLK